MIVKTSKGKSHATDLEEILGSVEDYNMHLNLSKYSFDMQACKLFGFMLTKRGI